MYGVKFGNTHYGNTLDFVMNYANVSIPEPKLQEIDVPGRNGILDITDSLGEAVYSFRQIEFMFTSINEGKVRQLVAEVHGRYLQIMLDRDQEYYYLGRCTANKINHQGPLVTVTVTAKCNPYKYKLRETVHRETISGSGSIILLSDRMPAIPEITASDPLQLGFRGISYQIPAGTCKVYEIVMQQGYNRFTVTGSGSIEFRWQEGSL